MTFTEVQTATLRGIEAESATVSVEIEPGPSILIIHGLPVTAGKGRIHRTIPKILRTTEAYVITSSLFRPYCPAPRTHTRSEIPRIASERA